MQKNTRPATPEVAPEDAEVIDFEGEFFARKRAQNDPYRTPAAKAAQNDARARLPRKYAEKAASTLLAAAKGKHVPNHNILTSTAALAYTDVGLHVIDAHALDGRGKGTGPGGQCKVPRGPRWQDRASNDPAEVLAFWTGKGNYPADKNGEEHPYVTITAPRNVSIAFPDGCGLFVLDIDGDAGLAALEALGLEHGPLPQTWESVTGSGGLHLIFRAPGLDIRNTASSIAPGVDIRGKNGQIIAPPSIHPSGKFYRWEDGCAPWECPVADAPEWLIKKAYEATKGRGETNSKKKRAATSASKKNGARSASDANGLEEHLATIGDHEGGRGFDGPIYAAACAYFAREGADADAESLVDALRETILAATCKDNRAERRYATDDYLTTRVEQARAFIAETAEPEPISLTTAQVEEAIAVAGIDKDSTEEEVIAFLLDHIGADSATRKRISAALGATSRSDGATVYTPNEVSAFWRKLDKDASESEDDEDALSTACGFDPLLHVTVKRLIEINEAEPFLFNHLEQPVELRSTIDGHVRFKVQDYDGLSELVSRHLKYKRVLDSGASVSVSPPMDVVKNIRHKDLSEWTLPLRGLAETPFFDKGGNLVIEPGYHADSQTYLAMPPDLAVGRVSATPSTEEVERANSLLFDMLGEFPFDGLTPEGIAAGKSASYANCVGLILLPQMREMIDGPTPGHLINKPSPGTGSGLLLDVASIIWTGKVATTMTVPKRQEEIGKTIIAKLRSGASALIFDNIPDNLDSDDMAMGIAQGCIDARVLGKNDASAVEPVEVRATWIFGGNNVTMSEELMRRMTLITLDARMAEPWKRKDWKHPDLKQWVKAHRSELVWACLTLIQNWIAGGRQPYSGGTVKGTFEQWLACVGGVVEAAGIHGFYSNDEELTETVADASADGLFQLASVMADFKPGHAFYVTGQDGNSIMDILNKGPGGAGDPILIDGWDYKDGEYTNAKRVGARFKKWAGKPQIARRANGDTVTTVEIGFDPDYDGHRKVNFYRLKIRMPGAKDWITAVPAPGAPEWEAWQAVCGQAVCGQAVSDHVD